MFYFAHGSNLSHAQMQTRCPGAIFVTTAHLHGYARQFDGFSTRWGGAAANVVPAENSSVQGALYELTPEHLAALDIFEGVGYERVTVPIATRAGDVVQAAVYLRLKPAPLGEPSLDYVNTIKAGMVDCGIEDTELSTFIS